MGLGGNPPSKLESQADMTLWVMSDKTLTCFCSIRPTPCRQYSARLDVSPYNGRRRCRDARIRSQKAGT